MSDYYLRCETGYIMIFICCMCMDWIYQVMLIQVEERQTGKINQI